MPVYEPFYDHDGITLFQGDCLEVLPTLAARSIDAVICDPPYGTTACPWDSVIPFAPMWEALKRLVKPRAALVLFGSQPFTSALVMSNPKWFRYEWVWEKDTPTGFLDANRRPLRAHENILVFAEGATTYNPQKQPGPPNHSRNVRGAHKSLSIYRGAQRATPSDVSGMKFPRSVVYAPKYSASETLHPAQKPLSLLQYLIATYTNAGDTVLDFTVGSGTTLVAAKLLRRRAIGIEIDEKYAEIAAQRLSQEVMAL